ncbi:flagellar biosynthesis protein FlhB [Aquabacterium sp. J223]|uniref:flagellar biosynthesis protein FlhB n=1 Tax=Aquabacterium sp. J223 TaxID=2898431 RepID=UPI0021ADDABB|nr:flagellar biosynthesis protein FlhB [Aquabacterium sp. J223]UUX96994.1 flagellar biosynthesis protein FlhB [Aquabacterium sp. J223]
MSDADKRLPPTEKRLRKAREEGQVARSRELGNFAAVAACGALLVAAAAPLGGWLLDLVAAGLRFDLQVLQSPQAMTERLPPLLGRMALVVLPIGALMAAVAVLAAVVTGGWNFTLKPLAPNFGKLNPLSGVQRLFSAHQLTETLKAVLLTTVLATIGALWLKSHLADFAAALALPLPQAFVHALSSLQSGLVLLLLAMALFAAVDVPLQRQLLARRLRMSVQEVKQEMKDAEGNVEVKAKIKARMREVVRRRMMAAVPTADLVVMNPTHYAVALKYDEATMAAPRVVAKGADLLALRIRDLAKESKVPVLDAPPLARALYAHAELDGEIPAALFSAVAQVLAYVYQLRTALAGRGAMPATPTVTVPDELDPHHPAAQGPSRRS